MFERAVLGIALGEGEPLPWGASQTCAGVRFPLGPFAFPLLILFVAGLPLSLVHV